MKFTIATEEEFDANCLIKAKDMAIKISDLRNLFHKYKYRELTEEQSALFNEVRNEIYEHFEGLFIEGV